MLGLKKQIYKRENYPAVENVMWIVENFKKNISLLAIHKRNMDICKLFVKRAIRETTLKIKYHVKNL